ncbi:MAG: UPF0182 family protein [Acidobacteria bacterium]|nr:UPF0182 family protein [Acidobacteriota bacterium]
MPTAPRKGLMGRGRWILIGVLVVLFILLLSLRGIAGFYTDYLWFDSLDHASVWREVLLHRLGMATVFTLTFFLMLWVSLTVADRMAPKIRMPGPEDELLARYHEVVDPRQRLVRFGVTALFALFIGIPTASKWELWMLFRNRQEFGVDDPQFKTDIGFYIFQLPFLSFIVEWFFVGLIVIIGLTLIAQYLNGGIRVRAQGPPVTAAVKVHLSVLLALLALVRAVDYWLQRYELTLSSNGYVDGAGYTDINARLPALHLLILISLFSAGLLLYNIRRRGWALPAVAVGLWLFVQIVMGAIYPTFVQWRTVSPAESERESALIERNIEATRQAYGLSTVDTRVFEYEDGITAQDIVAAEATVDNIRLLDPLLAHATYERLQGERSFYEFPATLDVDRYVIDGRPASVILGVRGLSLPELDSWEEAHVSFTHGYALAASPAGAVDSEGEPTFIAGDLPMEVSDFPETLDDPQVYYGENLGGYSIVNTNRDEVDYSTASERVLTRYAGEGGVGLDSIVRKAAFALRFGQFEPLLSSFITNESKVLYIRDIEDRVAELAPFLEWDTDPYAVAVDGRIHYILDGYTTSGSYPFSQAASGEDRDGSGLGSGFNYIRNSVKAVVDSYSGEVTLYRTPVNDPVLDAYDAAFDDLFVPFSDMPAEFVDHLRYPESLFRIQTSLWARYQVSDPQDFYDGQGSFWAVAQDPGREGTGPAVSSVVDEDTQTVSTQEHRVDPYHTLLQLPGETDLDFVNLRSFVNIDSNDSRKELSAFMVARADPDSYGELIVYSMDDDNVPGPALADERIRSNAAVSSRQTLLGQGGSTVSYGEMQLVPIGNTIVYVRPLYVIAEGLSNVPTLENVIVSQGRQVVLATNLQEGLEELVGASLDSVFDDEFEAVVVDGEEPPTDPEEESEVEDRTVDELLTEVRDLFDQANDALMQGASGFEEYGRLQSEIAELLEEAYLLSGGIPRSTEPPTSVPEDGTSGDSEPAEDGSTSPEETIDGG